MQFNDLRARTILGAAALLTVAGGVVATSVPANAATFTQHVGVLYTNKIYHYADSFGTIQHWVVAQGKKIVAPKAKPGAWSDQGVSWAGISSYGHIGNP